MTSFTYLVSFSYRIKRISYMVEKPDSAYSSQASFKVNEHRFTLVTIKYVTNVVRFLFLLITNFLLMVMD